MTILDIFGNWLKKKKNFPVTIFLFIKVTKAVGWCIIVSQHSILT